MDTDDDSPFVYSLAPAQAQRVVQLAREMLSEGLTTAEVCSLFTDAGQVLSKQEKGLTRDEWLDLCEELYDMEEADDDELEAASVATDARLTAPGGQA